MQKRRKLTWQGRDDGAGRWKKVYEGQIYYFSGGSGKSDVEAYRQAIAKWEALKVSLDQEAALNKPFRADYEKAINEWHVVLSWGRENDEVATIAAATAKLTELHERLKSRQPTPISLRRDLPISRFGMSVGSAIVPPAAGDSVTSGEIGRLVEDLNIPEDMDLADVQQIVNKFVVDRTWRVRIEREQRKAAKTESDFSLISMAAKFVEKRANSGISGGGYANLQRHLKYACEQFGDDFDVRRISGQSLERLHEALLKDIKKDRFTSSTAVGHQTSFQSFVRWLWEIEVLAELPRNLTVKSQRFIVENKGVRVFSIGDVRTIYAAGNDRVRLFMLLALNCGMTQIDISALHPSDVDWQKRTLSRKRGKTKQFESVPIVTYSLWPQTLALLKKFKSSDETRLLLAPEGGPLKFEVNRNGKVAKNDYIGLTFHRMLKAKSLKGQFKMLKKTSASMLRNHPTFSGLEGVFLDHAPRTMSDKHYTEVPTELLAQAIEWLREKFKLPVRLKQKSG